MKSLQTRVVRVALLPPHLASFKETFSKDVVSLDKFEIKNENLVEGWRLPKEVLSLPALLVKISESDDLRLVAKSSTEKYTTMTLIHENQYFTIDSFQNFFSIYPTHNGV